ncbi:hypothetical protein C0991_005425 [Blastosporella zonata]|nr:hypothetical protein C0991_005425 [Blastosporella zonata]
MSTNIMTASSVAPIFLTRPFLFLGISTSTVETINAFVQAFLAVTGGESQQLNLQHSSLPSLSDIVAVCNAETVALIKFVFGRIPPVANRGATSAKLTVPIPLALACHYFGIVWSDWYIALGGSPFTLVLKPTCVYVIKKSDGCIGIVWTNMAAAAPPARSASPSLSSPDTSDSEDSSSRPSSRSSNYSSFSFSSQSSTSSQSSIASFSKLAPTFTTTAGSFSRSASRPLVPITKNSRSAPTPAPKPTQPAPTKYLYQGGVSAVLTGGVMLGATLSPKVTDPPAQTPKAAVPMRGPVVRTSPTSTKIRDPTGPGGSWRRTLPVNSTA